MGGCRAARECGPSGARGRDAAGASGARGSPGTRPARANSWPRGNTWACVGAPPALKETGPAVGEGDVDPRTLRWWRSRLKK